MDVEWKEAGGEISTSERGEEQPTTSSRFCLDFRKGERELGR